MNILRKNNALVHVGMALTGTKAKRVIRRLGEWLQRGLSAIRVDMLLAIMAGCLAWVIMLSLHMAFGSLSSWG